MFIVEKGAECRVEDTVTKKRIPFVTRVDNVFYKEEVKWTSNWRVCFQHGHLRGDEGNPRYLLIVPKRDVKYA